MTYSGLKEKYSDKIFTFQWLRKQNICYVRGNISAVFMLKKEFIESDDFLEKEMTLEAIMKICDYQLGYANNKMIEQK